MFIPVSQNGNSLWIETDDISVMGRVEEYE